jgi:hypothetical protein
MADPGRLGERERTRQGARSVNSMKQGTLIGRGAFIFRLPGQRLGNCLRSIDPRLTIRFEHNEVLRGGSVGLGVAAGTYGSALTQLQFMLLLQGRQRPDLAC